MAIKDLTKVKLHLFLCNGGTCKVNGAEQSTEIIRETISQCGLGEQVHTTKTLCNGRCKDGPVVICMPSGTWFGKITPDVAADFTKELLSHQTLPHQFKLFTYGDETISPIQSAPTSLA
ncbi:(2Fe-2S) ferredoxin domain-containing protein [Taibaiella soli]|uniref:(2Fe-2S) ferredoxin domain-containing protein n=1 Tax=Taibaiella soli TaxID=1649169 RepID=UPI001403AFF8|nr:(2Fe-2S) ferredoxin domain-containing protein [Taibaiella soli]